MKRENPQPVRGGFPRTLGVAVVVVVGGQLEERITCGLPQSAGQLSAVLQDDLGGDDPQVNGQQLVALHHLALVILAVVSQQLSPGQMTPCSQPHNI